MPLAWKQMWSIVQASSPFSFGGARAEKGHNDMRIIRRAVGPTPRSDLALRLDEAPRHFPQPAPRPVPPPPREPELRRILEDLPKGEIFLHRRVRPVTTVVAAVCRRNRFAVHFATCRDAPTYAGSQLARSEMNLQYQSWHWPGSRRWI